jgi:hypothetical protein
MKYFETSLEAIFSLYIRNINTITIKTRKGKIAD